MSQNISCVSRVLYIISHLLNHIIFFKYYFYFTTLPFFFTSKKTRGKEITCMTCILELQFADGFIEKSD
jgi:uncharacterized membrane-anchored protein YitT (DUF2179 family)